MNWPGWNVVDKEWTLFLDRDGVINRRIIDAYVRNWEEWEWLPGVKEAIAHYSQVFGRVIIVTNQRGIARDLMTEDDLAAIHSRMLEEIAEAGGRIDAVFHCPEGDNAAPCRKPNPGMLFQAKEQFPEIIWKKCLMVGDAVTDMQMAWTVGIFSVFIGEMPEEVIGRVDANYPGLKEMHAAMLSE